MTDAGLDGRAGTRGGPTASRGAPKRGAVVATLAVLIVLVATAPVHAQRLGRRFRQAPPAPRPAAAAPARSNPGAVAPGAAPARSPTPAAGERSGGGGSKDKPQTTANPPRPGRTPSPAEPAAPAAPAAPESIAATDVAWDGVAPFGAEWRRRHPAAWRADADAGEIVLTAGVDGTTGGERAPAAGAGDAVARSVLESSGGEPELLVFPAAPDGPGTADAPTRASDGTVSVLARDGTQTRGEGADESTAEGSVVALAEDPRGAPWLSLGAFAAVPEGHAGGTTPHVFLELSLHRDGTVRGNYYDALADAVHPVAGRVDRDAGTFSWRVGNGPEFLTEADGLAAGRARVTVRKGSTERVWTLIALD